MCYIDIMTIDKTIKTLARRGRPKKQTINTNQTITVSDGYFDDFEPKDLSNNRFVDALLSLFLGGAPLSEAAGIAMIHPVTLASWIRNGRVDVTGKSKEGQFYLRYTAAKAAWERNTRLAIQAHPHWKAKAYLLEAANPEVYGQSNTMELKPVREYNQDDVKQLTQLTDAQLQALRDGKDYDDVINNTRHSVSLNDTLTELPVEPSAEPTDPIIVVTTKEDDNGTDENL